MATELEEEGREGQFQELRYLVPSCPSCSSRVQRGGSLTADTDRRLPPTHVPLTLPFRCHSTASPRFNILTLRAAEN